MTVIGRIRVTPRLIIYVVARSHSSSNAFLSVTREQQGSNYEANKTEFTLSRQKTPPTKVSSITNKSKTNSMMSFKLDDLQEQSRTGRGRKARRLVGEEASVKDPATDDRAQPRILTIRYCDHRVVRGASCILVVPSFR